MGRKTVGLVGLWDCVAFDEVAGIHFKDNDGVQIMKDYMASGSFARGKEEKAASASMVFVGNINQSVDVLLKTSSLFDPFPPEMGTDTAFLDRMHCYLPGWEIPKFRPEHFTDDYGFITDYLSEFIRELRKEQYGDSLDHYFHLGKNLNQRDTIAVRRMVDGYLKLVYPDGEFTKEEVEEVLQLSLEMRRRVKEQKIFMCLPIRMCCVCPSPTSSSVVKFLTWSACCPVVILRPERIWKLLLKAPLLPCVRALRHL